MIHYFAHIKAKKSQLGQWLATELPGDWNQPWTGPVGEQGDMAVRSAITAIQQSNNMQKLLKKCVGYTGDVDTVATIAMAAASLSPEIDNNLPDWLYTELENGSYGRDYIEQLDERLSLLDL